MFILYFTLSSYSSVNFLSILQRKHFQISDSQFLYSKHGFWEIATATIEERLRLYDSKARCFCPRINGASRINGARLHLFPSFAFFSLGEEPCPLSPSHGFSPYSHRQVRRPDREGHRGIRPYPEECHKSEQ